MSLSDPVLPKFSKDRSSEPFRYGNTWQRAIAGELQRLIIGPSDRHVELMLRLSHLMAEPLGILYVLTLSRRGKHAEGRYQSPGTEDRADVETFLQTFSGYFESDGRHHVWVQSIEGDDLLVYDRHNIIYAYGCLTEFEEELRAIGFQEGIVRVPVPHTHRYLKEYDESEDAVLDYWDWKHFPLQTPDQA